MASLCVNIDHIATLRQARRGTEPQPIDAVGIVERAGSTGITVHLREDQRHIQETDVLLIRAAVQGHLNLEMAATDAMVGKAVAIAPELATLVPERREEVTTEGGLDVFGQFNAVRAATQRLMDAGIEVSLFIDAERDQVNAARRAGARQVEFHTGPYCLARPGRERIEQLERLARASQAARELGLVVNAGHGLNYHNVRPVAAIAGMNELNIGHAIVSRAVFTGLNEAVTEMRRLIDEATCNPRAFWPDELAAILGQRS
jgi:pyridoxine 5-phosphate synthase